MHDVDTARHLSRNDVRPKVSGHTSYTALGLTDRVTTALAEPTIFLHRGEGHFRAPGVYFVGLPIDHDFDDAKAYVIEVLAYGFHDYAAREYLNKP